jgi:hypothetical protein
VLVPSVVPTIVPAIVSSINASWGGAGFFTVVTRWWGATSGTIVGAGAGGNATVYADGIKFFGVSAPVGGGRGGRGTGTGAAGGRLSVVDGGTAGLLFADGAIFCPMAYLFANVAHVVRNWLVRNEIGAVGHPVAEFVAQFTHVAGRGYFAPFTGWTSSWR